MKPRERPCKFNEVELLQRRNDMIDLQRAYPHMDPAMLELCWNWYHITPEEERNRIRETKEFDKPAKERLTGGVVKDAVRIISKEEDALLKEQPPHTLGHKD